MIHYLVTVPCDCHKMFYKMPHTVILPFSIIVYYITNTDILQYQNAAPLKTKKSAAKISATDFRLVAIIVAMLLLPIQNTFLGVHPKLISDILIWISVVFTIISGVDYIAKNWNLMEMK